MNRESMQRHHVRLLRWQVLAALLTVAPFLPALRADFVRWDDFSNIVENHSFRALGADNLQWCWISTQLGVYEPLSWMLKAAIFDVFGLNSTAFHAVSILMHGITCALILLLASRLLARAIPMAGEQALKIAAFSAAVLYGAHPLRVEVVAWASAQPYALATFFTVLALLAYERTFAEPRPTGARRSVGLLLTTLAYVCAVLSKSAALPLPLALVAIDTYPLRRLGDAARGDRWRAALGLALEKVPMLLIAAIIARIAADAGTGGIIDPASIGPTDRIGIAAHNVVFYVWKTIVPIGLSPFYALPMPFVGLPGRYWTEVIAATVATVVVALLGRRTPGFGVAWLAYLAFLAPVCGIVRHGDHLAADRYAQLSTIGLFIAFAGGMLVISHRLSSRGKRGVLMASAAVYLALATLSVRETLIWTSTERLWTHAQRLDPSNWLATGNLASYYVLQEHDPQRVLELVVPLVERCPNYVDARITMGSALEQLGRPDEAIVQFAEAARIRPADHGVLYYAAVLAKRGQRDRAIAILRERIARPPVDIDAFVNLGCYLLEAGQTGEGERLLVSVTQKAPWNAKACYNLAVLALNNKNYDEAEKWLRRTLDIDPTYPQAAARLKLLHTPS